MLSFATRESLGGVEFLGGVPGTVGGGMIMNAGTYLGEFKDVTVEVHAVDEKGARVVRDNAGCGFRYRHSDIPAADVVVGARLRLKTRPRAEIEAAVRELRDRRKAREPHGVPNAGSIFKNPPNDFAGRLIEACGLKGRRVGGAEVSPVHANWLVNADGATRQRFSRAGRDRARRGRRTVRHHARARSQSRRRGRMSTYRGKRIGVIMGGPSSERDVSLNSGRGILAALQAKGYDAVAIDWKGGADDLGAHLRREKIDVAWIALHGTYGEDGCVQGLLECYGVPYTGSGVLASALAMDKVATRRIFDQESIESPRWRRYHGPADVARIGFPLVVKPSSEGSSVGVSIVKDQSQLQAALDAAKKCHGVVLLEEYIKGREINVGVLDDEALGEVEIRPATEFYDYEAKYLRNDTQYLVPAPISDEERRVLHDLAVRAHKALGCAGATRVDLILAEGGRAVCLEINTLPGMTDHSLLPKIAAHRGMDYATLVERILDSAALHA